MTTSVKMAVFCDVATCSQVEIDHVSKEPSTSISEMLLTAKVTNRTDFFRTVQMLSFLYGIKWTLIPEGEKSRNCTTGGIV
jgi:hypothetical protein